MNIFTISLFDPTPLDEPIYPRFMGIAKAALETGNSVTHFTSTFRHTKKQHRFNKDHVHEVNDNYEVFFTHSMGYKKNISARRFWAHKDYADKLVKALENYSNPDVIFISMPPLITISKVTKWAEKKGIPVVIDVIDPWPDSFIKDVPKSVKNIAKFAIYPYYRMLRKSFEKASAVTAISNDYLKWAAQFHSNRKNKKSFFLAVYFDPVNEYIIKVKILYILNNPEKQKQMIEMGSKLFERINSPEERAEKFLDIAKNQI